MTDACQERAVLLDKFRRARDELWRLGQSIDRTPQPPAVAAKPDDSRATSPAANTQDGLAGKVASSPLSSNDLTTSGAAALNEPSKGATVIPTGVGKGQEEPPKLRPAARKAYFLFNLAEQIAGKKLLDREAFELLKEKGIPDNFLVGEMANYELPGYETWTKHLRNARGPLKEQKYSGRGRREGRSIVPADQTDRRSSTDD